jgi:hypothetical protein
MVMKTSDVDRIINDLGEQIARDIDTQVMMSALGWMAFEISEGTVYGQKYLTVHPTSGNRWNEMMDWTVKTFGPSAIDGVWTPDQRWYANNAKFWFRDAKDLEWFMLKWS